LGSFYAIEITDRRICRKIEKFSGKIKVPPENQTSSGKLKLPLVPTISSHSFEFPA
jgi:hypothetical protein